MKGTRTAFKSLLAAVILAAGTAVSADTPALDSSPWSSPLPPGRMNLGVQSGDQQAESFGDVLVPVAATSTSLLFINPRGSWNDDAGREFNIGLGCRRLFPDNQFIAGLNVFYDRRESDLDNRFNQFGLGAEFLSVWVDARANAYLPEGGSREMDRYAVTTQTRRDYTEVWAAPTGEDHRITQSGYDATAVYNIKTTQHFQMSERSMEGVDAEIGVLLPIPHVRDITDIKVFAGYYDFNAQYGPDVAGMKGRVEVRPLPALILDAGWYEDKELLGSRYTVGARASLPFDLARLSHGRNPFSGALDGFRRSSGRPPFASRLTDMVIRDLHIRTEISPLAEVVPDRRVETTLVSHDRHDYHEVLASGVTFVDGDNQGAVANGTWENPYPRIAAGVQDAVGTLVYVRAAARPYREAVTLKEGQTLWGSGALIQGRGNRVMGGIYPVLNSDGSGPAITLANRTTVAGMGIVQTPSAAPQDGIYGNNVTGITLRGNIIEGGGRMVSGIHLEGSSMPVMSAVMQDNRVSGAQGSGITANFVDVGELDLTLSGDQSTGNGGHGVSINASLTAGDGHITLDSITASGNGLDGVQLDISDFGGALDVGLHNVVAEHNRRFGVSGYLWGRDGLVFQADRVSSCYNLDSGMALELYSAATLSADFFSNDLSQNPFFGLEMVLNSGLSSSVTGRGNRFVDNGAFGLALRSLAPIGSYDFGTFLSPGGNRFDGNGMRQVLFGDSGTLMAQGNWWGTPTPVSGIDYVFAGGASIDASHPLSSPP